MPKTEAASTLMSDEAVAAKTGKTWREWFRALDRAGAAKMSHKEIVAYLSEKQAIGPWWRQMVTVAYERERGLRVVHETATGFSISRSRTFPVSAATLFEHWTDKRKRGRWLNDPGFVIRKATANKSLRITWVDGETSLEVMFYEKETSKTQITVQHSKLADAKAAAAMKEYWGAQLDSLQQLLAEI